MRLSGSRFVPITTSWVMMGCCTHRQHTAGGGQAHSLACKGQVLGKRHLLWCTLPAVGTTTSPPIAMMTTTTTTTTMTMPMDMVICTDTEMAVVDARLGDFPRLHPRRMATFRTMDLAPPATSHNHGPQGR